MNSRLIYFFLLFFFSFQSAWSFSIPVGWSAASFALTSPSSPSEIFGSELLNIEEIVGLEGQNFTSWKTNSVSNSNTLTKLHPDKGYFIKSNSAFELAQTAVFSLANYPLTTGFQLIPLKSERLCSA